MSDRTAIRRNHAARLTDTQAINHIAALLGASEEWDSGMIESVAQFVGWTGRPRVGDQSPKALAMYRRAADRLGIAHDGED
jgi:hypothetical protein